MEHTGLIYFPLCSIFNFFPHQPPEGRNWFDVDAMHRDDTGDQSCQTEFQKRSIRGILGHFGDRTYEADRHLRKRQEKGTSITLITSQHRVCARLGKNSKVQKQQWADVRAPKRTNYNHVLREFGYPPTRVAGRHDCTTTPDLWDPKLQPVTGADRMTSRSLLNVPPNCVTICHYIRRQVKKVAEALRPG